MQLITTTVTGVGSSPVSAVDYFKDPFNIGLGVVVTGTVAYTVEYTFSDPSNADYDAATAVWFPVTGLADQTANKSVGFTIPCRGIRISNGAGDGSATLMIQQAGTR